MAKVNKRRIAKICGIVAVALIVLVVVAGVTVTRPFFIKSVVLPRVEKAIGVNIRIQDLSLSPFSRLELQGLRVGSNEDPLLRADRMLCRYKLFKFFDQKLAVEELSLKGAEIMLEQSADGSLNLPTPVSEGGRQGAAEEARPSRPDESFLQKYEVAVEEVKLEDVSLRFRRESADGSAAAEFALEDFSFAARDIGNGREFSIDWKGHLHGTRGERLNIESARLKGDVKGGLSQALLPEKVDIDITIDRMQGQAGGVSLDDRKLAVKGSVLPLEPGDVPVEEDMSGMIEAYDQLISEAAGAWRIRQFRVSEQKEGTEEFVTNVTGWVMSDPLVIGVDVKVDAVEAGILNLAAATAADWRLGENASASIRTDLLFRKGLKLAADGKVRVQGLMPHPVDEEESVTSRPLSLAFDYRGELGRGLKSVALETLRGAMSTGEKEVATLTLEDPVTVAVSGSGSQKAPGRVGLTVDRMDLTRWLPLVRVLGVDLPVRLKTGQVSADFKTVMRNMGENIGVQGNASIENVRLNFMDVEPGSFSVEQSVAVDLRNFNKVNLDSAKTVVRQLGKKQLSSEVTGTAQLKPLTADLDVDVNVLSAALLNQFAGELSGWNVGPASASLQSRISVKKEKKVAAEGSVRVQNVRPRPADKESLQSPPFSVTCDYDAQFVPSTVALSVKDLKTELAVEGNRKAQVWLEHPAVFSFGEGLSQKSSCTVGLKLQKLQLAGWLPLAEAAGVDIPVDVRGGGVSANFKTDIRDIGQDVALEGDASVENVAVAYNGVESDGLSLAQSVQAEFRNFRELDVKNAQTNVEHKGEQVLSFACPGANVDVREMSGKVNYKLPTCTEGVVHALPLEGLSDIPLESLQLEADGTLQLHSLLKPEESNVAASGEVRLSRLDVRTDKKGGVPPMGGRLIYDTELSKLNMLRMKKVDMRMESLGDEASNAAVLAAVIKGKAPLAPTTAPVRLDLHAKRVVVDPLLAMAQSAGKAFASADRAPENGDGAGTETASGDSLLTEMDVKADFRVDRLSYREMTITQCSGKATLDDGVGKLEDTELQVNGAPGQVKGEADLGAESPEYEGRFSLKNLELAPVGKSFVSADSDIQGKVTSLKVNGEARGETPIAILKTLAMDTVANMQNLEMTLNEAMLKKIPGLKIVTVPLRLLSGLAGQGMLDRVSPELRELAERSGQVLEGQRPLAFSEGTVDLHVKDREAHVRECRLKGDLLKRLSIDGVVSWLTGVSDQKENISMADLNPALNLRVGFAVLDEEFTVPVRGRLRSPQWSRDSMLRNILKSFGSNMVENALKQSAEDGDVSLEDVLKGAFQGGERKDDGAVEGEESDKKKPSEKEDLEKKLQKEVIDSLF